MSNVKNSLVSEIWCLLCLVRLVQGLVSQEFWRRPVVAPNFGGTRGTTLCMQHNTFKFGDFFLLKCGQNWNSPKHQIQEAFTLPFPCPLQADSLNPTRVTAMLGSWGSQSSFIEFAASPRDPRHRGGLASCSRHRLRGPRLNQGTCTLSSSVRISLRHRLKDKKGHFLEKSNRIQRKKLLGLFPFWPQKLVIFF